MSFWDRIFGRKGTERPSEETHPEKATLLLPAGQASVGVPEKVYEHVPGTSNYGNRMARFAIVLLDPKYDDSQATIKTIARDHPDIGPGTRISLYRGDASTDPEFMFMLVIRHATERLRDDSVLNRPIFACRGFAGDQRIEYNMIKIY